MKWLLSLLIVFSTIESKTVINVGHFPNVTHIQGVVGHQLSRQGKGWFEERLGPDVEVHWYVYDSGPSAMEGIFTESLDLSYVGPNPAINAYVKSNGKEIRIISGSASGGAALIVQPDKRIVEDGDFRAKKIGTPGFGNTQDVAARSWLQSKGYLVTKTGGDVIVVPTEPASQLLLFKKGDLDAVWTIEPWVSLLLLEGKGKVYFDEKSLWPETEGKYVTTHLVSRKKFLDENPHLVKKWLLAHLELTEWVKTHPEEAKILFRNEVKDEVHFTLPKEVLDKAWNNIELTVDPISLSLNKNAREAFRIGFLKGDPNLKDIYDLRLLNEVLKEKGKPAVE